MARAEGHRLDHAGRDDRALVEQAMTGDTRAYEHLVRRYQTLAWRAAYVITGSAADAEDAAQEAFVKAYSALPRFRTTAAFKPWLLTIVANEARNRVRAAGRQASLHLRVAVAPDTPDPGVSPEAAAEAADQRRVLAAALGQLTGRDREVIAYRHLLGLSEAETAQVLGCARGTVKSALSRALGRLRALLDQQHAQPDGHPPGSARTGGPP